MPKHLVSPQLGPAGALATIALIPALTSCDTGSEGADGVQPVVLTTFTVLADMTENVGGERVDVRSITPAGAEVHEYDPTPGDLRNAAEADLILENGLGLEEWFGQFIDQSEAPSATLTEGIETRPITRVPGHPDDAGDSEQMPADPHAWMSPHLALTYVDNIEKALSELAPEDADYFAENAEAYREEITALADEAEQRAKEFDGDIYVVTCEGAFGYLAEDLGFEEHYLWPLNADDEGTPQQVEAQIRFVEEHSVPTVFCESTVNDGAQQQVAEATGADLGDPLYVDSLSDPEGPVPSYLELLAHDIDLILDGAAR